MESFAKSDGPPVRAPRIAIVAGEASGDILGAGLMSALRERFPQAVFEGVGGPRMLAEGFISLFAQDRLAVMGLVEPLKRLPELLSIRRQLRQRFTDNPPDVFIGIDSPAFNTDLELSLRKRGIKTVHYVSPSVWAWRQGRIKKIAQAVDLMLTLFPFEAEIYHQHNVPVTFVGHPLADQIPLTTDTDAARLRLSLPPQSASNITVALLPGSRASEVEKMGALLIDVARYCYARRAEMIFVIPSASEKRHSQLQKLLNDCAGSLPITLIAGRSHEVMAAADIVVMASGTTTLEALLLKKPMVITYKLAAFSYWLFSKLVKVKVIGLPNLLAGKTLVPEFIQHEATTSNIGGAVLSLLADKAKTVDLQQEFTKIHYQLKQDANMKAAQAVTELLERGES